MLGAGVSGLYGDLDVAVQTDVPLGAMTWFGIGGDAELLIRPNTTDALATLIKRCRRTDTPLRVLGNGANLLVDDEGIDGVVIQLDSPTFREIKYNSKGAVYALRAMAGADMAKTLMDATRRGLDGISQMAGIPASIGGAIRMNAGGAFGCIGDAVEEIACMTDDGETVVYPKEELSFAYRKTNIPDPIILWATLNLNQVDPVRLRERVKEIFAFKKSTQPLADNSAGCAFKNPLDPVREETVHAGKLIDEAGLKGFAVGGAMISDQHANFILTRPGATAADVTQLLEQVRVRVYEEAGIELEAEVVIWKRDRDDT